MQLRFLFTGIKSSWQALNGHQAPDGDLWEIRSLPGGHTAWGASLDEATKRLQRTIDAALDHANHNGKSMADWWCEAVADLDAEDNQIFVEGWADVAIRGLPSYERTSKEYAFEYASLLEEKVGCP